MVNDVMRKTFWEIANCFQCTRCMGMKRGWEVICLSKAFRT